VVIFDAFSAITVGMAIPERKRRAVIKNLSEKRKFGYKCHGIKRLDGRVGYRKSEQLERSVQIIIQNR
jgi:hypothetical protein